MERTVSLVTIGCKLNQYETQVIEEAFVRTGYRVVPFGSKADVCIINSCTVTGRSDYRSRQMARRARKASPSCVIVMAGCYPQRDAETVLEMPEIDLALGNIDRTSIPGIVESLKPGEKKSIVNDFTEAQRFEMCTTRGLTGHTRAFIKIQDGCNERCTYCAVRGVRGPERSRPFGETLDAVKNLVGSGFREIVLTGVHVGKYGSGLDGNTSLGDLLSSICEDSRKFRIRLSSMEPCTITDELIALVAAEEKICNHFHIPLQSGDDRVLGLMGRPYDPSKYTEVIGRISGAIPECGLGADVMVGFPTEDDSSFESTVGLVESLPLSYLHVFSYSKRPGTPASGMAGEPPGDEKKRRSRVLREIGESKADDFKKRHIGRTVSVLSEGRARGLPHARGHTSNYLRVYFESSDPMENEFVHVRVESAFRDGVVGVRVDG